MNLKLWRIIFLSTLLFVAGCSTKTENFTNSIGMKFVLIPDGSFKMGEQNEINAKKLGGPEYLTNGDYDEKPLHKVIINEPFYMSITEVTVDQFKKFRPSYVGVKQYYPYTTGISWEDAVSFCKWLSEKEGKNYRLPTEAEWEYSCRAGTRTPFYSGESLVQSDSLNPWGLMNMENNIAEWVWDWYGSYSTETKNDPVGPASGFAKVVRGAGLDRQSSYYSRSANRAGIAPNFPSVPLEELHSLSADSSLLKREESKEGGKKLKAREHYKNFYRAESNNEGNHNIGFRIVQAKMPDTKPSTRQYSFAQQCIIQNTSLAKKGPNPSVPYFRKRNLLPIPPDNTKEENLNVISALGFNSGILKHNHSPSLAACPNGDILAVYYTSVSETDPNVALMASRLRFGADQWDMPTILLDFPDVDDHAPLLWTDGDTLRLFWGANKLESGFPFHWINSTDNGETWSSVHFPVFETLLGRYSAQPINSAFRDNKGNIHIASDAIGAESVLWESTNNGKSWIDPGGRTGGRHTTFALLSDGKILGMGGKSSDINGYMPESISEDGGRTWKFKQSPFPSLGSNQRPTIIKLQDGKLFFAGDLERKDGYQPKEYHKKGAYAALSSDDGKTWHIKKIPGVQLHEDSSRAEEMGGGTLGYSVARQAPNGVIHLITSMNTPCLDFAFNEAWILSSDEKTADGLAENSAKTISNIKPYKNSYESGEPKASWSAGIGSNGRYILNGNETFYYKNGQKQWEAQFDKGEKKGTEVYYRRDGNIIWKKIYKNDGTYVWTNYFENGQKKSESSWKNKLCIGTATEWDKDGNIINQYEFKDGFVVKKKV